MELVASKITTPLGQMIAIADTEALHFLNFADCRNLPDVQTHQETPPIISIKKELIQYFNGSLKEFKTPLFFQGTPFQKSVWKELKKIPYGQTRSYADIAESLGKPTAFRAAALANGANRLLIVIPCHRVINKNGNLGGFSSGLWRKKWLLDHEKENYG